MASKTMEFETVMNVSNAIMQSPLLASEASEVKSVKVDSVASFESIVARAFG